MRVVQVLGWAMAAGLAGVVAANLSMPAGVTGQWDPMSSVHIYWYMGRAGGFVAYGLLLASVVLGLAVSSRVFDGVFARPWVFEMHQFLSLFVVVVMLFHGLVMLPDPYAQFSVGELLIPFASHYRPVPVGVGVIILYGSAIVSATFYMKRFVSQGTWRVLHYLPFPLFLGATVHGIMAGTDSAEPWAQLTYLSSGLAVLFLTFFRILASRRASRKARPVRKPTGEPVPVGR